MPDAEQIIEVAVPRPLHAVYDYHVPAGTPTPAVGARVRVPFGRSETVGICTAHKHSSTHNKLKSISQILDAEAMVPPDLMALAHWMNDYYHHPLGEVLATLLPAAARRGAACQIDAPDYWTIAAPFANARAPAQTALYAYIQKHAICSGSDLVAAGHTRASLRALVKVGAIARTEPTTPAGDESPPVATSAQQAAIDAVTSQLNSFNVSLLQGVTGSGKTEVYLRVMAPILARQQQVLVLVPEIALTPQTLRRFQRRYGQVGMLHSNLTDHERLQTWLKSAAGQMPIIIGTRSAVFTPFSNLGLIIVDEEHDSSYKQQEGLRYSARDLTAKRAQQLNIPLVLGSATPSLESLYNVDRGRYRKLTLSQRAAGAQMPSYHLIDMRGQQHTDGLSIPLEHVIRRHLEKSGQVLIFLNRRGFAPALLCAACGWQAQCSDCDARLTLHRHPTQLMCHHCGLRFPVPDVCESCGQHSLMPVGMGTQRTEAGLQRLFADVPVYRIDRDSARSNRQLEERFARINTGAPAIMVGTQMLAKGHHFPNVTLVAILNADAGFLSPDFRAPERTAQLIIQVAGRAGRAERPGEVWIQSYQPDNPTLVRLIEDGYPGFAELELAQRVQFGLPPAQPMALIRAESGVPDEAVLLLNQLKSQLAPLQPLGPVPAPLARQANRARYQLMLVAPSRSILHGHLRQLQPPKVPHTLRCLRLYCCSTPD
ncbi:MAG: primosomal protein N' [Pseudomonadota bacterium]